MGDALTISRITIRLWLTPEEMEAVESRIARERAEAEATDASILAQWEADDAGR